ncbi:hypothetical protein OG429_35145 [Streptomyces sp. NBC_00190]|uniref:hypothetical protein n=1 Tax=unclassified Streptomyces TaxID=2593676 RepID=UPI002E2E01D2|nr:hypothetical protein [Streptomyces sp. NBC_00190]WSZ44046.1 hypothetical protein OG239_37610 [Streptomyces sp. NBC_00868]
MAEPDPGAVFQTGAVPDQAAVLEAAAAQAQQADEFPAHVLDHGLGRAAVLGQAGGRLEAGQVPGVGDDHGLEPSDPDGELGDDQAEMRYAGTPMR